jgi:hypothetical protein
MSFDSIVPLYLFSNIWLIDYTFGISSFHSYTSIGSIYDTVPNSLLSINNSSSSKEVFRPAYLLSDGRLERAGRVKKLPPSVGGKKPAVANGLNSMDLPNSSLLNASAIAVGDEIL